MAERLQVYRVKARAALTDRDYVVHLGRCPAADAAQRFATEHEQTQALPSPVISTPRSALAVNVLFDRSASGAWSMITDAL